MIARWCLTCLLLALISGCSIFDSGPTTEYRYIPPESETGRLCIASCQTNRTLCCQEKKQKYRECQQLEELRRLHRENCLLRLQDDQDRAVCYQPGIQPFCWLPNCHECDTQYRECYQNCGGSVEAYTVP